MKKLLRKLLIVLTVLASVCLLGYLAFRALKKSLGNWEITTTQKEANTWAPFIWAGDSLGHKYYKRAAMMIPISLPHMPAKYYMQFDLGCDITMLYETSIRSIERAIKQSDTMQVHKYFSRLQVTDISMNIAGYTLKNTRCMVEKRYGTDLPPEAVNDTNNMIRIGTLGSDVFKNKVLIIDYPRNRFAICDRVPDSFASNMINVELDKDNGLILPMTYRGRHYRLYFDNGSSIFALITVEKNIGKFATGKDIDTIPVRSWGLLHNVTGKITDDSFSIGNVKFPPQRIYVNHTHTGTSETTDATTGNALLWDKTIVIDYKNKQFGMR